MERTIISWNIPNWITIFLMAAAGYAVLGVIRQVMMKGQGMTSGVVPSTGGY